MSRRNQTEDHICVRLTLLPDDHNYHLNGRSLTLPVSQIHEGYEPGDEVEKGAMVTILFGRERLPVPAEILSSKLAKLKPVCPEVYLYLFLRNHHMSYACLFVKG